MSRLAENYPQITQRIAEPRQRPDVTVDGEIEYSSFPKD